MCRQCKQLTVKELIESLMQYDENLPVEAWDDETDRAIPVVNAWEDVVEKTLVLDIAFLVDMDRG